MLLNISNVWKGPTVITSLELLSNNRQSPTLQVQSLWGDIFTGANILNEVKREKQGEEKEHFPLLVWHQS